MSDAEYLRTFGNRVRRLRETAGLTIQGACDQGELSANFWGRIERGEQEPGLHSIRAIARGLGVSTQILMALDDLPVGNNARNQINDILDLCSPDEVQLSLEIVRAIHDHHTSRTVTPGHPTS